MVSEAGAEEGQAGMTQDPGQGKPRGSLEMGDGDKSGKSDSLYCSTQGKV